jgi:hypothetical protein
MEGVHTVHRKIIGEMDRAAGEIERFGTEDNGASTTSTPAFRPSPPPRGGGSDNGASAYSEVSYPSSNPFLASTPASRYYDPETRATLEVPAGYVLYREPGTNRLTVVSYASLAAPPASGDRPERGKKGCGATGIGIVTPECEKKRRAKANPFATR